MANTDTTETAKTRKVADHFYLDASGNVVEEQEKATGIRYQVVATKENFDFQVPGAVPGSVQTMIALFGAKTLAINTASQNRQDPESDVTDPVAISERFSLIKDGDWGVSRGGGGGARIDIDLLIEALGQVYKKEKKPFDPDKYGTAIRDNEEYRKKVFSNLAVKARYMTLKAEKAGGTAGLDLE
jgi:hypothetical protein